MCQYLGVSRSGYYERIRRKPSTRKQRDQELIRCINKIFNQSRQRYGSPRIQQALKQEGIQCGKKRVVRLMKQIGIAAKRRTPYCITTKVDSVRPVAENLLNRQFTANRPNNVWVTDITYVPTKQGWLYLVVFIDLYSKMVVGWAMATHMRTELVLNALHMAIKRRHPTAGLMIHSDRGCQYTSEAYQRMLTKNQFICSMSRKGNCWDNAVAESFFGTMKEELLPYKGYPNRLMAQSAIFEYIEVFYNRQRLHSAIGYTSPHLYEIESNVA